MTSEPSVESILAGLEAEARRRFGPERAEALAADLAAMAADLARVAAAPLPPDEEPGFYLIEP